MFKSDNMAVVCCLRNGSCRDGHLCFLLRELSITAVTQNFTFTAIHLPGCENKAADALSRFNFQTFYKSTVMENMQCQTVPQDLLAVSSLNQSWQHLLKNSSANNTQKTYSSAQKRFLKFCEEHGFLHQNGSAVPASELTILRFIGSVSGSCQASTIRVYLSAVRSLHIQNGAEDPLLECCAFR